MQTTFLLQVVDQVVVGGDVAEAALLFSIHEQLEERSFFIAIVKGALLSLGETLDIDSSLCFLASHPVGAQPCSRSPTDRDANPALVSRTRELWTNDEAPVALLIGGYTIPACPGFAPGHILALLRRRVSVHMSLTAPT